jgi:hypothetical protein
MSETNETKNSALRFMFSNVRFTPFQVRFTLHEGNGGFVSCSFHLRFMRNPFVSHFTGIGMKCETKRGRCGVNGVQPKWKNVHSTLGSRVLPSVFFLRGEASARES